MAKGSLRRWGVRLGLAAWAGTSLFVVSTLMGAHYITVPLPEELTRLKGSVGALRESSGAAAGRFVVHVIYENCSCTNSLFDHLVARGPTEHEMILFVEPGKKRARRAKEAGFGFKAVTSAELSDEFALAAAPILVVSDAAGRIEYLGGYYETPATVRPRDVVILSDIARGEMVTPLPAFGCAVDPKLQSSIDPLGIKY